MAANLTQKQIVDLKEAFSFFDMNKDGFIKKVQVKEILVSLGMVGTDEQVKNLIKEMDADGDGVINFPEFLNIMAPGCADSGMEHESELRQMFTVMDLDKDGYITHSELKRALGDNVPHSEVEEMIKEADGDCDGKISFDEFEAIMKAKYPDQYQQ